MKYIALATAIVIVGLDQFFKYLAVAFLSNDVLTLPIIQDVFHLTYIENRGAAFSIFEGKIPFLIILTGVLIAALIFFVSTGKVKSNYLLWSLTLIIGGGIGNIVDRIFRGYVVDYLDFRLINFAVFNFADCCVVIGTILVLIYIIFLDKGNSIFTSKKPKEEIQIETEETK